MKAMTYTRFGGPEALTLTDLPEPRVAPGEVLVRVRAASVNPVDWKVMAGGLDALMEVQFPVVPGWDVAGVVEKVGLDTPEFEVGDEIIAYARKDWVHAGTAAELVSVPVRTAAFKPASSSWEEAASIPLAGLTAYQTLGVLGLGEGETVLVHGGSGGVGLFAVQIARAFGARVIATASARNHELLRSLGAEPVEYGPGLAERVRALAPEGVDISLDLVGGVVEESLAVLADGGRFGSIADHEVLTRGGQYLWVRPDAEDLTAVAGLVESGAVKVVVAETYPLERLADAYRVSMTGRTVGKIAVTVSR